MGVVIDSRLTLSDHIAAVCRSGYYQLRQLRPTVRCSSDDATKTLVQAFIVSHLDYCNALFNVITDELIRRLLSVQNTAARLVTGTRRSDHTWIISRLCSASYTSFRGRSASCRVQGRDVACLPVPVRPCSGLPARRLCQLVTDVLVRELRSADIRTLAVNRTYSSFGDRTFAAAGTVWNSLPPDLTQSGLPYGQFRRSLKTFLFGQ